MKKLVGSFLVAAFAGLAACGGADEGAPAGSVSPVPPAVDAAAPSAPVDAGPADADASPPAPESQTILPSQLETAGPYAPANQVGTYEAKIDEGTRVDGAATMLLQAGPEVTTGWWAATTAIVPRDSSHKGSRYRLRAKLKTEGAGAAFAWFRIDTANAWAIDNMLPERALSGDHGWTEVSLVLDVPPKALRFAFGSGLKGAGRVWIGPITLESVDKTVPVTGH